MKRSIAAGIVFVAAFALYLKTLAPAVGPTDSGELTTAVWSLGNAHPPGFPFFLMLTHLFTWLPFGSIAVHSRGGLPGPVALPGQTNTSTARVSLHTGCAFSLVTVRPV